MKFLGPQGNAPGSPAIIQKSNRTAILETIGLTGSGMGVIDQGTGDLFITDIINPIRVTNPQAHVWAWHYNAEGGTYQLEVQSGYCWIFGWKDEVSGSSANLTGGLTEILGYNQYGGDSTVPEFVVSNAAFSIAMGLKCVYGSGYTTLVRETRGGTTKDLLSSANPGGFPTKFDLPMYTGYDATHVQHAPIAVPSASGVLSIVAMEVGPAALSVRWSAPGPGAASLSLVNSLGRNVRTLTSGPGVRRAQIDARGLAAGSYRLIVESSGRQVCRSVAVLH